MARNIEIKACVADIAALAQRVAALATQGPTLIFQDDTFFCCASGRLKLRAFSMNSGELIYYRRANEQGPKESFYLRMPIHQPDALREILSLAYGQVGRVIKHRTLYMVGRTRVHLDQVEGLGQFMELEVVLHSDEPAEVGMQEAQMLMQKLEIQPAQLIQDAYVDLQRKTEDGRENKTCVTV